MEPNLIDFSHFGRNLNIEDSEEFKTFIKPFQAGDRNTMRILYIGHCFQDSLLLPFIRVVTGLTTNLSIEIYTVKGKGSLNIFNRGTFQHTILGERDDEKQVQGSLGNTITIKMINPGIPNIKYFPGEYDLIEEINLDNNHFSWENAGQQLFGKTSKLEFDTIFCCFEFHFCINWRNALINLLGCLRNRGVFLFGEAKGSISLIDGNFDPLIKEEVTPETFAFFKEFRSQRTKFHYWSPEISFTNYVEVKNYLNYFFDEPIEILETSDSPSELDFVVDIQSFRKHLHDGNFVYLSLGLSKEERTDQLSPALKAVGDWQDTLRYGVNYYFSSGFNKKKFDRQKKISWNYSTFSTEIQELKEFRIDELTRKSLDIFASHDTIFPFHTKYVGIISWPDTTMSKLEPIQLLCHFPTEKDTPERTLTCFSGLASLEKEQGFSFFDLMFNSEGIKYPITFQNFANDRFNTIRDKNNFVDQNRYETISMDGDDNAWVAYKINSNRRGDVKSIAFGFSDKFGKDYLNRTGSTKKLLKLSSEGIREIKQHLVKIKFKFPSIEHFTDEVSIGNEKLSDFFYKMAGELVPFLKNHREFSTNIRDRIFKFLLRSFYSVYNFQLKEPNTQLRFYPSTLSDSRSVRDQYRNQRSLGGIMIFENITPFNHSYSGLRFRQLVEARNKVLTQVASLILYKAGLISYVAQDYQKHARKAAIAAISARNVSHNLGSHVIPSITSVQLRKIIDDEYLSRKARKLALNEESVRQAKPLLKSVITDTIRNYNYSLDYLQHRNDFINYLASGKSGWAISVWFIKNLMARFYRQYFLLNYLASYEGLEVYNYDEYTQYKEAEWFGNFSELAKHRRTNKEQKILIYGYLNTDEHGNFCMTERPKYKEGENNISIEAFNHGKITEKHSDLKNWKEAEAVLREQSGRKFKILGNLFYSEKDKVHKIRNVEFIEGKLIIKVRKRQYLDLDSGDMEPKNISRIMSSKNYINVSRQDLNPQELKNLFTDSDDCRYVFGVIREIDFDHNKIVLFGIVDIIASFERNEELKNNRKHLEEGIRIILSFSSFETDNETIFLKRCRLEEIVKISSLVIPMEGNSDRLRDEDVLVAIPGGISGFQSFYTILENIIRNAAKHNWNFLPVEEKIGRNLEVKIEIDDQGNKDKYICKIWTNVSDLDYIDGIPKYKDHKLAGRELVKVKSEPLAEELNYKINNDLARDIIKEGEFRKKHIGISEIKINAAYLQSRGEEIIDDVIIKGKQIILKEKQNKAFVEGYIKASQIMEYEKGKIVRRLGYRLVLQKPKEVVIVSDKRFLKLFGSWEWDPGTLEKHSIFRYSNEESRQETLDFEYCILFQEEQTKSKTNEMPLASLIMDFLNRFLPPDNKNPKVTKKDMKIFTRISNTLERYPYRTFIVLNDNNKINDRKALVKGLRSLNIDKNSEFYRCLDFIKKRIRFLNQDEIFKWNTKEISDQHRYFELFKLYIYHLWISVYENNTKFKYDLQIELGDYNSSKNNESVHFPGSMPPSLRAEYNAEIKFRKFYNRLEELKKLGVRVDIRENEAIENKDNLKGVILRYTRHNTEEKEAPVDFVENLSGGKNSFTSFMYCSNEFYLKSKFLFQLYENGHATLLILDERISKYYTSLDKVDHLRNFANCNLIVPHHFTYNSDIPGLDPVRFFKNKFKLFPDGQSAKSGSLKEFKDDSPNMLELHYLYNGGKPQINTLIIHQSFLEKIVKYESFRSGKVDTIVKDLIRRLKLEFPSLIITSGKNKSDLFSDGVKFLPFSVVEDLVMTPNPDKLLLTQILFKTLS